MADLDIGGLVSPDQLLSASESLAAQQRLLAREIFDKEPDVDDQFFADWSDFTVRFLSWKAASSSWFSRVWTSTRDELVAFIGEYGALRERWAAIAPTNATAFNVTSNDTIGGALERAGSSLGIALRSVAIGAGILLAVGLAAYFAAKKAL